jgi:uncharacterized protein
VLGSKLPKAPCANAGLGLAGLLIASASCFAELPRLAHLGAAFTVDSKQQVVIAALAADSNGSRAGLQRGDIVLEAGGTPAKPAVEFVRPLIRRVGGDNVAFKVQRAGKELTLTVSYVAPPKEEPKGLRVEYASVKVRDHERRTLITIPTLQVKKRLPAILFLPGSGCGSQESPRVTDPVVAILHQLTRHGFITMRVEKTGIGDSGGPPCYSDAGDMTQEVEGYRAGFAALANDPMVDPKRIYLFGHSAGATLAPLVARDLKIAKIAVVGAMGSNFLDYILAMRDRERALEGRSKDEVLKLHEVTQACLTRLLVQEQSPDAIEAAHPECRRQVRFDSPAPFSRQWHKLDLSEAWSHVKAPTLVVYGTGDFVTSEFESQALVVRINANSSPKKQQATYQTQAMDHGFWDHANIQDAWNAEQGKGRKGGVLWSFVDDLVRFFNEPAK